MLDGAMGTMIQGYELGEARLPRFSIQGLASRPQRQQRSPGPDPARYHRGDSRRIPRRGRGHHRDQLVQLHRGLHGRLRHAIAGAGAEPDCCAALARRVADRAEAADSRPRFVAGVLGPTNRTASLSPDVNDPGFRNIEFRQLVDTYAEAVRGLLEGGADLLMVETIFDTLNAKAAIFAIDAHFAATGERVPVWISGTITDASGRTLSGQTTEAFWNSVAHARPLVVGLNCALGARRAPAIRPGLEPGRTGLCEQPPQCRIAQCVRWLRRDTGNDGRGDLADFAEGGMVNIVGGCCGTTPPTSERSRKWYEGVLLVCRPSPERHCRLRVD